jgi:hypothetical protein
VQTGTCAQHQFRLFFGRALAAPGIQPNTEAYGGGIHRMARLPWQNFQARRRFPGRRDQAKPGSYALDLPVSIITTILNNKPRDCRFYMSDSIIQIIGKPLDKGPGGRSVKFSRGRSQMIGKGRGIAEIMKRLDIPCTPVSDGKSTTRTC